MIIFIVLCYLGLMVVLIAGYWKAFEKANQPGWACLIPIYSFYIMTKIGGVKNWWMMFIPIANIYIYVIAMLAIAKSFGKSTGFGIGLILLNGIFFPILGFGSATYLGPNGVSELENNVNAIGNN